MPKDVPMVDRPPMPNAAALPTPLLICSRVPNASPLPMLMDTSVAFLVRIAVDHWRPSDVLPVPYMFSSSSSP